MGSKRIKILHVYKTSLPQTVGGIEVFLDTLCRTTQKLGADNTIFSLAKQPLDKMPISLNGYRVIQGKENFHFASTGFSLSAFSIFSKLAAKADVIHYHFPNPFADFLHVVCKIKKPSIVTYHSDIIQQKILLPLYQPLMNRFLGAVNCLVATSSQYLETSQVLKKFREKTRVISIGLDRAIYPEPAPERVAYWQQRLPQKFLLFIGVLRYYKGLHLALDALAETNFHLVIAGTGNMEKKLKAQAQRLGLSRVYFLGKVSDEDKMALLHLCHAFLFPSFLRSEAFGISLLEASMCGKPSISAEIGTGTSFINIHGETGLIVPPGDAQALRKAMYKLYEDDSLAAVMGKNAQKRYQDLFTADKQARAYAKLYQELVA